MYIFSIKKIYENPFFVLFCSLAILIKKRIYLCFLLLFWSFYPDVYFHYKSSLTIHSHQTLSFNSCSHVLILPVEKRCLLYVMGGLVTW